MIVYYLGKIQKANFIIIPAEEILVASVNSKKSEENKARVEELLAQYNAQMLLSPILYRDVFPSLGFDGVQGMTDVTLSLHVYYMGLHGIHFLYTSNREKIIPGKFEGLKNTLDVTYRGMRYFFTNMILTYPSALSPELLRDFYIFQEADLPKETEAIRTLTEIRNAKMDETFREADLYWESLIK